MFSQSINPKKITKIAGGWAAFGDGWAVHATTKELVIKEYEKRVEFYKNLLKRPVHVKLTDALNEVEIDQKEDH
jgi:hypothetical protein